MPGRRFTLLPGVLFSVDILNLDEALFDEINRRVREVVPVARNLLTEKIDSAAALAQEKLDAVWELIFALPVYRDLKMDEPCNYHTFQRLMADGEKWARVQDSTSEGYAKYQQVSRNDDWAVPFHRAASGLPTVNRHDGREVFRAVETQERFCLCRGVLLLLHADALRWGPGFRKRF